MEADVRARCGRILFGKVASTRILRQYDRADVPLLRQHGPQQYARAPVRTASGRLVYLAGVVGSAHLTLDFAVGAGISHSTGCVLRHEGFGDLCLLGVAHANGAMCDIWIIPADLPPALSVFAVLQSDCGRSSKGRGVL